MLTRTPQQLLTRRARLLSTQAAGGAGMPPPLKGVRILDLTRVLAGPYATMMLADLGAEVIKVERPQGGDDTRAWIPPSAPLIETPPTPPPSPSSSIPQIQPDNWNDLPPESAYFLQANRGKRSLGLDFKKEEGKEVLRELVKRADVLVENYVPGCALESSPKAFCKALNPRLIYASISGYGQSGPFAQNPGYDVVIEAEAGLMHITGEPTGPPVKVGVAITDLTTGLYAKSAILAALLSRAQTGLGVHIDANLFDSQIASLANIASNYLIAGREATRQGTAHPSIVPYQVFHTQDGFIMIAAGNDSQFKKFSALVGAPEWSDSPSFATNSSRVANRSTLIPLIEGALSSHSTSYWLKVFKGKGFPFAPVNDIKGTFEHPQTRERDLVREIDHPRAGKIKLVAPAVQYNGKRMEFTRPPPVLRQHTVEVLRELGYSDEKMATLQQKGIV
ncbi:hypothetical protein Rt10032_c10g4254 [Rhodotorula toruloides]|uniref:CAIB/BAIF family enzyme n=1 Tax=Rhodotorula toruloides TaxID=5286 RepID=A0A511KIN1_RHOTO|nr:hypothetical protein Rt10032_c10g4254 [Rhodotorula toruloides]